MDLVIKQEPLLKRSEKYFLVVLCVVVIDLVSELLGILVFADIFHTDTSETTTVADFLRTLKQVLVIDIF